MFKRSIRVRRLLGHFDALAVVLLSQPRIPFPATVDASNAAGIIDRWRGEHGSKCSPFERRQVREHVSQVDGSRRPWAANNLRSMLKVLCRFAMENDWRRDDPTIGVRPTREVDLDLVPWQTTGAFGTSFCKRRFVLWRPRIGVSYEVAAGPPYLCLLPT